MQPSERREREKQNLRRAIMDAARDLFLKQGYQNVSMRRIASQIGYSPTAIYLHFHDKDEILTALAEEGFELLLSYLKTARGKDATERLFDMCQRYLRFAQTHPHYYTIMFLLEHNPMVVREDTFGHRTYHFLRQIVVDCQASGLFKTGMDPDAVAHTIWAMVHGMASLRLAGRVGPTLPPGVTPSDVENVSLRVVQEGLLHG